MEKATFESYLDTIADHLTKESRTKVFNSAKEFEDRVREIVKVYLAESNVEIDFNPHQQAFPDIEVGEFGIEVKFTTVDSWRSVANSVMETNRIDEVKHVYLIFGKMGGTPEVKWASYEKSVMHVRTSHVPRFEVEVGTSTSLFDIFGITYDAFRALDIHEKMQYIRTYARSRLKTGERLWWLEDSFGEQHSVPIQARLYTSLSEDEKIKVRSEAILLCPQVLKSGASKGKYDDVALYLLTYHGILSHQTRDLFSAGSVANPDNDDSGGSYIKRAILLIQDELKAASLRMDEALFEEYWGINVEPELRISEWLRRADTFAMGWKPSEELFLDGNV